MSSPSNTNVPSVPNNGLPLSRLEQAAVLLMTLGENDAAEILKHLGPKEVQRIGTAMSNLSHIQQSQVQTILVDFLNEARSLTGLGVGTERYIRNMLVTALGEDKANGLLDRILLGGNTTGLDTLKWMEPRSVADIIRNEHPQIQAIVIAYLESDMAAEVLQYLHEKVRVDVLMRVATLETVQPSALQELNTILEKQFSGSGTTQTKTMGGVKVAADIVNFLEIPQASGALKSISEMDQSLSNKIQELMFVFENLGDIDDRDIQILLRDVPANTLLLALKGAEPAMQQKIFRNMSSRAVELLQEDMAAKGPVRISEVEAAQKEIIALARRLAEEGSISLGSSAETLV